MKYAKILFTLLFAAAVSCSKDTATIDPVIKAEREALEATQDLGFYRNGEALFLFQPEEYQLLVNPSKCTFTIQDDGGEKFITLQLDGMPTESKKVKGTITNNMGISIGSMKEVILLKSDDQYLWFWNDKNHVGIIFPRVGM